LEKEPVILGKCKVCGHLHTIEEWNDRTRNVFDTNHINEMKETPSLDNSRFACPLCRAEQLDSEVDRAPGYVYPIATTISYTMMVAAVDENTALAKAEQMSLPDVIAEVSQNPTVEFEAVDD
jgi:hypothetical protein